MDPLTPLLDRLDQLIANLDPASRRRLAVQLARGLRGTQAARIKANQAPDGTPYPARKPQPHLRSRRGGLRMFRKLAGTRWLKPRGTPDEASLGFAGFADRVARVHHYGLRDRVNRLGTQHQYQQRELLGFTAAELERIEQQIIDQLGK